MFAPAVRRLSAFRVALLATLATALVYLPGSQLGLVRQVEGEFLDLRFHARPPQPSSGAIVLVLIDDRSLAEIGRWPWSRSTMAALVERLEAAGARTIALDLLLAEPETGAVPTAALVPLLEDGRIEALAPLIEQAEGDRLLAEQAERTGNVVLPILFELGEEEVAPPPPPPFVNDAAFRVVQERGAAAELGEPPRGSRLVAPITALGRAAAGLGHVNAPLDRSGAQRLEYPVIAYGADYYPSFSLEIARDFLGVDRDRIRLILGQGVALADRIVPTDESMRLPINYGRSGRFPVVSAADVLAGEVDPALFAEKIVLIGGTAAGIGKTFVTPFDSLMPEIERHATVVDSILRQDFLGRRQASVLIDLIAVMVAGVLLGAVAQRWGMLGATIAFGVIAAGLTAANLWAFIAGLWLNLFLPLAALTLIYLVVLAYSYFVGKRQERMIRAAFEHYLSPDLVDLVCRDPTLLRLGGERRELTVLFADIRESTRLAQILPPDRFAALLNDVLGAMTGVLFARGGMLDKFTGDGFLAIFGAPLPQRDHALRGCCAALDMLATLETVRARWTDLEVPLEVGIGINSGPMIIGNMGSAERFTYTVIGDEAHLGARLESANKDFRTRILISESTWRQVRDQMAARELDLVRFRGLDKPVRVFELLGEHPLAPDQTGRLQRFETALAAYQAGNAARAESLFEALHAETPDDYPVEIYLERCRERRGETDNDVQPAPRAGGRPFPA